MSQAIEFAQVLAFYRKKEPTDRFYPIANINENNVAVLWLTGQGHVNGILYRSHYNLEDINRSAFIRLLNALVWTGIAKTWTPHTSCSFKILMTDPDCGWIDAEELANYTEGKCVKLSFHNRITQPFEEDFIFVSPLSVIELGRHYRFGELDDLASS